MTTFEKTVTINKPVQEVYDFLKNLEHHEQLMPDNIQDWKATVDEASFAIKNMARLSIKVNERIENTQITAIPNDKAPFDINLNWKLSRLSDDTTTASFVINADLNMMLKMIASTPLQKLVDFQVNKLQELLG